MSTPQAIPSTGYRPRSAPNQLKDLVEEHYEELRRVWDERFAKDLGVLHPRVQKLFESFTRCGDLHFGFVRLRCVNPDCTKKAERVLPFSCKVRGLCPSCGQRRAIEWAERMVEEVLPRVPYRQVVFTIPRRLRKYFLFDRALYGDLCRAAYKATRDFLRTLVPAGFPKLQRAVPAMLVVPQSFGDLLVAHPHAHALVSLGLFLGDGSFHALDDVDFSALEESFRERVFQFMLKKGKITEEVAADMRAWPHSGFQVSWERRIEANDRKGLEGLLAYMDRPPVSLRRLTYRPEDGLVHYQGTKLHPRLGRDHQLLPPLDFLGLLVAHVLLRYEVTIRCYGALSTTFRKRVGWVESPPVDAPPIDALAPIPAAPRVPGAEGKDILPSRSNPSAPSDDESDFTKKRRRDWAKLIAKVYFDDPSLCASCGEPMKIVAAITSPHQDDVIERILRHMKIWDPPWTRERRARGPPSGDHDTEKSPQEVLSAADPIEPDRGFEEYAVDPPWSEDL